MTDTFMSPIAPVRWCKLMDPVPAYDPKKYEYTIDMVLDYANPDHKAFLDGIEKHYLDEHGKNAKRSNYAINLKADKENPDLSVLKFKLPAFSDKKGSFTPGPTIMDAAKNPWGEREIGNGSTMRIQYSIFAWNGSGGAGITFQPHVCQVIGFSEYTSQPKGDPSAFDPIPGGFVAAEEEATNCPMPGAD